MKRSGVFAAVLLGAILLASCERLTYKPLDELGYLLVQESNKTDKKGLVYDGELILPMEYDNFQCFQADRDVFFVIAEKADKDGVFRFTPYGHKAMYFAPHIDGYDIEGDLYWVGTLADGREEVMMSQGKFGPCDEIVPIAWGCVFRNGNLWGACDLSGKIEIPCKYKKIYYFSTFGYCLYDSNDRYVVYNIGHGKYGYLTQSEIDTLKKYAETAYSPYSFYTPRDKMPQDFYNSIKRRIGKSH